MTHRCPHISCQLIFFPSLFSFYHPPSLPHWCELLLASNAGAHGMVMRDEVKFMDGWIEREGFGFSGRGVGAAEEAAARSKPSGLVLTTWDSVCVCMCMCMLLHNNYCKHVTEQLWQSFFVDGRISFCTFGNDSIGANRCVCVCAFR